MSFHLFSIAFLLTFTCMCITMRIYMHEHRYAHLHVCVSLCTFTCVCISMRIYMSVHHYALFISPPLSLWGIILLPTSEQVTNLSLSTELLICCHYLNLKLQCDETYPVLHEKCISEPNNMSVGMLILPFCNFPGLGHDFSKNKRKKSFFFFFHSITRHK